MSEAVRGALQDAMQRGMREFGRSSDDATKHALIAMARSAGPETPKAKPTRPVFANPRFAHLLRRRQYKQYRGDATRYPRYFKYATNALRQSGGPVRRYGNDRKQLAKVPRAGLAKSSWKWGLRLLGAGGQAQHAPIGGVVSTYTITQSPGLFRADVVRGREMENRLQYIGRVLKAGWEDRVGAKAANWLRANLERRQAASMGYELARTPKRTGTARAA